MFYVYAVSKKKCHAQAEKKVSSLQDKDAPKTQSEYFAAVEKITCELFKTAKPVCVSGELSTPSSVDQFIELAKETDDFKNLKPMRKRPITNADGEILKTKGGRVRYEFVEIDTRYINDMSTPCLL